MRTRLRLTLSTLLSLSALVLAVGCGSSATTSTATSPTSINRCAVTVNGSGQVPAQGGAGSLAVSAARECVWAASAEGQWLSIKAGSNGQGDGAVEFAAVANPDPAVRRGAIVLNEQRVEVTQAAGECVYSLSEGAGNYPQSGGSGQFEVRASSSLCAWTAESDAPWVSVRAGGSSRGTATVQFDVAAAAGAQRSATITAAGLRFSVLQTAVACTFSVSPGAFTARGTGDVLSVTVTTGPSCPWNASSGAPWISLTSAAAGTGPGVATFNIAASSAARNGSVVVAGQTVGVNQGSGSTPCSFAISPDNAPVPAGGGAGRVSVSTGAGCAWTAASNADWLTITGGGAGNGPGEVTYQAAGAPAARTGTLTIAGRPFTVTQAGPAAVCTFSIAPEAHNVDANERNFNVDVNTTPGCAWAAASNAPWITLREAGGTGSRDVRVTVAANTGAARTGTATIAGRTLTITQAAVPVVACEYRVSPRDMRVDDRERRFARIEVETSNACSWTAVSNVEWISIVNSASGTGNGEVWISVRDNDGRQRTGTLTIAGQTVTVTQRKD